MAETQTETWTLTESSHQQEWAYWIDDDHGPIAAVVNCFQADKIARLIASAPALAKSNASLLAALEDAGQFIADLERIHTPHALAPNSDSGLDWDVRFKITAALAQAKGEA